MSDSAIIAVSLVVVVFFILLFTAVPVLVFWYSREDARTYDGIRDRLVDEVTRLSATVDELVVSQATVRKELYEERRERVLRERDLEIQIAVNIQLGDQIASLEQQVSKLQTDRDRVQEQVNSQRLIINGLIAGVMILIGQLNEHGIIPEWRPAGQMTWPPEDKPTQPYVPPGDS